MRSGLRPILFAACMVLAAGMLASPSYGQRPARIKFARGTYGSNVAGFLKGYRSKKTFVLTVRGGQKLRTSQIGSGHPVTVYIKDPNGEGVGDSDASCNNRREISPTVPGDYLIEVVECQKADPWRGRFTVRVTVH